MRTIKLSIFVVSGFAMLGAGCATHDHRSVQTYDYREDDDSQSRSDRAPRNELNSEYQMVSPGEMQSPGKPVVQPR